MGKRKRDKIEEMMRKAKETFLHFSDPMDRMKREVKRRLKRNKKDVKN